MPIPTHIRSTSPVLRSGLVAAVVALAGLVPGSVTAGQPLPQPGPDRAFTGAVMSGPAGAHLSAAGGCARMRSLVRRGNGMAGLHVRNLRTGRVTCSLNPAGMRSLASNTKLFTTITALARMGPTHRFATRLFAVGKTDRQGTLHGNLYLKGGGDPALGTDPFLSRYFGGDGTALSALVPAVKRAGIRRVTGHLFADDTVFDRLRGVADSGYGTSSWIGPLSGLSLNAGYTSESLARFSPDPARLAARSLAASLRAAGVAVKPQVGLRRTPPVVRRTLLGRRLSPALAWNVRVTNLDSNNFFAEMLLKDLGAAVRGAGTTRQGAIVVRRLARAHGVTVRPVDGSGLTRSNRSSAKGVVRLLRWAYRQRWGKDLVASLPLAGSDGTLANRMQGSAAAGRCRAKTGTLTGVSTLSGYCFNPSGRRYVFSILMNGVYDPYAARLAQDRITAMIAAR